MTDVGTGARPRVEDAERNSRRPRSLRGEPPLRTMRCAFLHGNQSSSRCRGARPCAPTVFIGRGKASRHPNVGALHATPLRINGRSLITYSHVERGRRREGNRGMEGAAKHRLPNPGTAEQLQPHALQEIIQKITLKKKSRPCGRPSSCIHDRDHSTVTLLARLRG